MSKAINKNVKFVKIQPLGPMGNIVYRVKSFGDKETVIIVDKKATTVKNENTYQDMECYKADNAVKLAHGTKKY